MPYRRMFQAYCQPKGRYETGYCLRVRVEDNKLSFPDGERQERSRRVRFPSNVQDSRSRLPRRRGRQYDISLLCSQMTAPL